jgi:hypothetical protein
MTNTNPAVKSMSRLDMERTILEILTDNGMDENTANKSIDSMSTTDMERFLSDTFNIIDEDNADSVD